MCVALHRTSLYDLPQVLLVACRNAYFRAMSDLGSRAIVMAAFLACYDKPQTSSWLKAVVELCHYVLWTGEWTGVRPPLDGQLRNAPPLALLACWPLQGRTADLLRAVHVQVPCLQLLAAWYRNLRAAEQLECCASRACERGVEGDPQAAVEPAERRISACLGLVRAECIAMPRTCALDGLLPPLRSVFRQPANSTYAS